MEKQWVVRKRNDMLIAVICSVVGLIIVTALVTFANYAMYADSVPK